MAGPLAACSVVRRCRAALDGAPWCVRAAQGPPAALRSTIPPRCRAARSRPGTASCDAVQTAAKGSPPPHHPWEGSREKRTAFVRPVTRVSRNWVNSVPDVGPAAPHCWAVGRVDGTLGVTCPCGDSGERYPVLMASGITPKEPQFLSWRSRRAPPLRRARQVDRPSAHFRLPARGAPAAAQPSVSVWSTRFPACGGPVPSRSHKLVLPDPLDATPRPQGDLLARRA